MDICKEIIKTEHLSVDTHALLHLIVLRNSCLPREMQFTQVDIGDITLLVHESELNVDDVCSFVHDIKQFLDEKRMKDQKVSISLFENEAMRQHLHRRHVFMEFCSFWLKYKYNIILDEDHEFLAPRNKICVSFELTEILRQQGMPMSIAEIQEAYQSRCPSKPLSLSSLRVYLNSTKEIQGRGKTMIYGLKSWKDFYAGNMVDWIYQILSEANTPLSEDEIYGKVVDFSQIRQRDPSSPP